MNLGSHFTQALKFFRTILVSFPQKFQLLNQQTSVKRLIKNLRNNMDASFDQNSVSLRNSTYSGNQERLSKGGRKG